MYENLKNKILTAIVTVPVLILLSSKIGACPYCNLEFYNELLDSRGGTLAGQELLASIKNPANIPGTIPISYFNQSNFQQVQQTIPTEQKEFIEIQLPSFLLCCSSLKI